VTEVAVELVGDVERGLGTFAAATIAAAAP
jgi:hypothetical protein